MSSEEDAKALPAFRPSDSDSDPTLSEKNIDKMCEDFTLRDASRFYHAQSLDEKVGSLSGLFPSLLEPFRDETRLSFDYPLWVADPGPELPEIYYRPLRDLLSSALESLNAEGDEVRILKDNLGRLECSLKEKVAAGGRHSFPQVMDLALKELEDWLGFSDEQAQRFSKCLLDYKALLPQSGKLLGFAPEAPVMLFLLSLKSIQLQRRGALYTEIQKLTTRLENMLAVDRSKAPHARQASHLNSSLGLASSFVDSECLATLIPQAASESMSEERRSRIETMTHEFKGYLAGQARSDAVILVPEALTWLGELAHEALGESMEVISDSGAEPMLKAGSVFDEKMKSMAKVLGSLRLARLEVENQYRDELHGDFYSAFNWRNFTREEFDLCPPVVVIDEESMVFKRGDGGLASLLLSGRPVQTLVLNRDLSSNWLPEASEDGFVGLGKDLGEMAVSLRRAFVFQSSSAQPQDLISGFVEGLSSELPALYRILSVPAGNESGLPNILWCNAAHESRAFPSFIFNPKRGALWGSRFDIKNNPQKEEDWPVYEIDLHGSGEQTEIGFTWADFASKIPGFEKYFRVIPESLAEEDFLPLTDYLQKNSEGQLSKLPYIWMVDEDKKARKMLVSSSIVLLCQESLDAWHRLQDLGGAKSYHAIQAARAAREESEKQLEEKISALKAEHSQEIENVRTQASFEAMEKLSHVLMNLGDLPVGATDSAPVELPEKGIEASLADSASLEASAGEAESDSVEEEEEDLVSEEAWIETFRCTTCNECTNLNPNMFKYNAEKQAYIADINAGSFEDLVVAAEKCSTKVIHPGKPLNPDEPNLEALLKRAEPFN